MKNILIKILFLTSLFYSCKNDNNEVMLKKLQGDWSSVKWDKYYFCFRGSEYFQSFEGGFDTKFRPIIFRNDTMINPFTKHPFNFSSVTNKYIRISINKQTELPFAINTSINKYDGIKLISLEVRFFSNLKRRYLDWALKINDQKECFMKVDKTIDQLIDIISLPYKKGNYFAKLSDTLFNYYEDKFLNIPWGEVKNEYISRDFLARNTSGYRRDPSSLLFECNFLVKETSEVKKVEFIIRGLEENAPSYLSAFLIHLNKIHDLVEFEKTGKLPEFKFYNPEYDEYLFKSI